MVKISIVRVEMKILIGGIPMTIEDYSDEYYMREAIKEARKAEALYRGAHRSNHRYRWKNYFPRT